MFHFLPCFGFSEILPGNADGGTHFRKAVIYPGVGGVLRVLQFFQCQICCDNQRLSAAVSAVNHVVNLFKPVFCATLHAEIVKDILENREYTGCLVNFKTEKVSYKVILSFNRELLQDNIPHTQEDFIETLSEIDFYERYCKEHPEYENNRAVLAIQNIERVYSEMLEKHNFGNA